MLSALCSQDTINHAEMCILYFVPPFGRTRFATNPTINCNVCDWRICIPNIAGIYCDLWCVRLQCACGPIRNCMRSANVNVSMRMHMWCIARTRPIYGEIGFGRPIKNYSPYETIDFDKSNRNCCARVACARSLTVAQIRFEFVMNSSSETTAAYIYIVRVISMSSLCHCKLRSQLAIANITCWLTHRTPIKHVHLARCFELCPMVSHTEFVQEFQVATSQIVI